MFTRIATAASLIVLSCTLAAAQSSTATSGTTKSMTTAPTSGTQQPFGQSKAAFPPAARSGEKGLRVGEGAADQPVEIKRQK